MPHVVTDKCIKCKFTSCVPVCPSGCFKEGPNMLVIDPELCIDCSVCIIECPANAIKAEEDIENDQERVQWLSFNAKYAMKWPTITNEKAP